MDCPAKMVDEVCDAPWKTAVAPTIMWVLAAFAMFMTVVASELSANTIDVGHIVQSTDNQIDTSTIIVMRVSDGQRLISNPARATAVFARLHLQDPSLIDRT